MEKISYEGYYWQNDLIRLRPVQEDDWQKQILNKYDSESRFLLNCELELPPSKTTEQKAWEKYIDFNKEANCLMFSIETLEGDHVGSLNLNSIDERNGTFSIGIQINRDARNKGYGTSAFKMVLRYAFFERRLHKYNGGYVENNIGSEIMHKNLGCKIEGVRRETLYHNGKYWNEVLCGLTMEEFIHHEGL